MRFFKRRIKIDNIEETNRLPVIQKESVFREKLPTQQQINAIRDAKEYLFQNTIQIKRLTNLKKDV